MKRFLRSRLGLALIALLMVVTVIVIPLSSSITGSHAAALASAPPLGTAANFAVLGAQTVTNTGPSVLTGNLGVSPGTSCTGFPAPCTGGPGIVNGTTDAGDTVAATAQTDAHTAYTNAAGQTCNTTLTGQDLGGLTLTPGVYCFASSAFLTTGNRILTLSGSGVFIFQIGSTLITASNAQVVLTNGATANNVFWQVGSSATLGTGTSFIGSILAEISITATTGASSNCGLYALTGAVTLDTNTISTCIVPPNTPTPTPTPQKPVCKVSSNSSMVEMGEFKTESSIADIVQVECNPIYSQNTVTISSPQLFNFCQGRLSWSSPFPYAPVEGSSITVTLDNDGNATVAVWGGPSCAPHKARIFASLNAPPFTTVWTYFNIQTPRNTKPGVTANPSTEVEDNVYSSVATVIQVEFPSAEAGKSVNISSQTLLSACAGGLKWVGPDEMVLGKNVNNVDVHLDNNSNAFVVLLGGASCASGTYLIAADLTTAPFTTYYTKFTVKSPRRLCC